jgi:hypothetical protein
MRIAIDLNDVIRDYTNNFGKYFKKGIDHSFDIEELDVYTNDFATLFPFKKTDDYNHFVYEDYSFELFGACPPVEKNLPVKFNNWINKTLGNIDTEEENNIIIVSPMENELTIQSTYYFLSKIGCRVREVYLPKDSNTVWNKCDVLITANPLFIETKPKDKQIVKIKTTYNEELKGDYEFDSFIEFMGDENNILKVIKNGKEKK